MKTLNKFFLTLAWGVFVLAANAQPTYKVWRFGARGGLNFNTTPVSSNPSTSNNYDSPENNSVICNNAGVLQIIVTGDTIRDRNENAMPNGRGIKGNKNTAQGNIIVPKPGSSSVFYVFSVDQYTTNNGIFYSEVDMSLNGGLGDVVSGRKDVSAYNGSVTEKLTATVHCNGTDYWVVGHRLSSNQFIIIPVTSAGVGTATTQAIGAVHLNSQGSAQGCIKFSPDGKRLVSVLNEQINNFAELYNFNNSTGVLSNLTTLPTMGGEFGASFSPDNSKLYISIAKDTLTASYSNRIVQYDMLASNIPASGKWVANSIDFVRNFGALQLGPDGQIYMSIMNGNDSVHAITNPNAAGLACNFIRGYIKISPATSRRGLVNCIDYYMGTPLKADFTYQQVCVGTPMSFTNTTRTNASTYAWNFGDPASGAANTSSLRNPSHTYAFGGTFYVTLTATDVCGVVSTKTDTIRIATNIPVTLNYDTLFLCVGEFGTINASVAGSGLNFSWLFTPVGGTETDMGITLNSFLVSIPGKYKVVVSGGGCSGSDSMILDVNINKPTASIALPKVLCPDSSVTLDAGTAGTRYKWSTGATTRSIKVATAGYYSVEVYNGACYDSTGVAVNSDPITSLVLKDATICLPQEIAIVAPVSGFASYNWSTGDRTARISVSDTGIYYLTAVTDSGCTYSDSAIVVQKCPSTLFFPTAFSPNDDGINDVYYFYGSGISDITFRLYNRWGEMIWETNDITKGWDGKFKGKLLGAGRYFWTISYKLDDIKQYRQRNGYLDLLN